MSSHLCMCHQVPSASVQLLAQDRSVHIGLGCKVILSSTCMLNVQVTIATQTPGLVLITVTGFNIPKGPQNYSLAVQGDFTGVLASPQNPSWNRTSATSCSLPLTQITGGPLGLVNSTTASFTFTSSTGRFPDSPGLSACPPPPPPPPGGRRGGEWGNVRQ